MKAAERGSAVIEFIWVGVILLVPLVYVVLSVFEVQRHAFATSAAARAAGRAFVLAGNDHQGHARAEAAARQAFADQGIEGTAIRVTVSCGSSNCHQPGAVVTVKVAARVRLPLTPVILGHAAPSIAVDSSETVPYGQYQEAPAS